MTKCTQRGVYKNLKDSPFFYKTQIEGKCIWLKFSSAKKQQMFERRVNDRLLDSSKLLNRLEELTGVRYCPVTLEDDIAIQIYKEMEHK